MRSLLRTSILGAALLATVPAYASPRELIDSVPDTVEYKAESADFGVQAVYAYLRRLGIDLPVWFSAL